MFAWLRNLGTKPVRAPARTGARRFDAAIVDRLTQNWQTTNTAIDHELRLDLDRLRMRSRDLFKNNEYAAKFGRMVRNNVVGAEGFTLHVYAKDPAGSMDTAANRAVEDAFSKWSRPGNCEVTGQRSFAELTRSLALALARDGEFLVRRVRGSGAGAFGYQLQLLDVSRIDTLYNVAPTATSNAVVMGVEIDAVRRPVAYWLWSAPLDGMVQISRYRDRVPASEIIHRFIPIQDEQSRGVPWMHAAMRRLNDLGGYREAAVVAARQGACKMGFYTAPDGQPAGIDGTDDQGNFIMQASPGEFGVLPHGYGFQEYNPAYPHDQFDAFCKAALRGIAGAIGVAYNGLANDLEGVNFSSIRAGVLDERDEWIVIQNFLIGAFLIPVFEEWLDMALLRGAITLPNGAPLPAAKRDKFANHVWLGRRWQWVDPEKDVNAAVIAIGNGLTSPQRVAAQTGTDIEDVLDEIAKFQALVAEKKITLMPGPGKQAQSAPVDNTNTTTTATAANANA